MSIGNNHSYKLIIFGMKGVFSLIPFQSLIKAGVNISAVILPRDSADDLGPLWLPPNRVQVSEFPMVDNTNRQNIHTLASENQIPIMTVGNLNDEKTVSEINKLEPDLIITLCFPRMLPQKLLAVPKHGCLNLHPSMLPAYRGPAPLFWQFRAGEKNTGVTLHFMDEKFDTGDIVSQKEVVFPEGISAHDADILTAKMGGGMIVEAISKPKLPRFKQEDEKASYQAIPDEKARTISGNWEVKRAYNFLRGADEWAPFWYEKETGEILEIKQVIDYQLNKKQPHQVVHQDGTYFVQLENGLLRFN